MNQFPPEDATADDFRLYQQSHERDQAIIQKADALIRSLEHQNLLSALETDQKHWAMALHELRLENEALIKALDRLSEIANSIGIRQDERATQVGELNAALVQARAALLYADNNQ